MGLIPQQSQITKEISEYERKPIVELKIQGQKIETDQIQAQISRLNTLCLRCFWRIITKEETESSILLSRPKVIDEELLRLSEIALGSPQKASFAVKELLPLLADYQIKEATQIIFENFQQYKKEKQK